MQEAAEAKTSIMATMGASGTTGLVLGAAHARHAVWNFPATMRTGKESSWSKSGKGMQIRTRPAYEPHAEHYQPVSQVRQQAGQAFERTGRALPKVGGLQPQAAEGIPGGKEAALRRTGTDRPRDRGNQGPAKAGTPSHGADCGTGHGRDYSDDGCGNKIPVGKDHRRAPRRAGSPTTLWWTPDEQPMTGPPGLAYETPAPPAAPPGGGCSTGRCQLDPEPPDDGRDDPTRDATSCRRVPSAHLPCRHSAWGSSPCCGWTLEKLQWTISQAESGALCVSQSQADLGWNRAPRQQGHRTNSGRRIDCSPRKSHDGPNRGEYRWPSFYDCNRSGLAYERRAAPWNGFPRAQEDGVTLSALLPNRCRGCGDTGLEHPGTVRQSPLVLVSFPSLCLGLCLTCPIDSFFGVERLEILGFCTVSLGCSLIGRVQIFCLCTAPWLPCSVRFFPARSLLALLFPTISGRYAQVPARSLESGLQEDTILPSISCQQPYAPKRRIGGSGSLALGLLGIDANPEPALALSAPLSTHVFVWPFASSAFWHSLVFRAPPFEGRPVCQYIHQPDAPKRRIGGSGSLARCWWFKAYRSRHVCVPQNFCAAAVMPDDFQSSSAVAVAFPAPSGLVSLRPLLGFLFGFLRWIEAFLSALGRSAALCLLALCLQLLHKACFCKPLPAEGAAGRSRGPRMLASLATLSCSLCIPDLP